MQPFDTLILDNGGFRPRGQQVTRLETFVDAAFAFAVTSLVLSFDAMPDSFTELYDALRRLPACLAGFAILALFWTAHHRFSRRCGPAQQGWLQSLPGMAYALLGILMPWHAVRAQRRTAALLAQRDVLATGTDA